MRKLLFWAALGLALTVASPTLAHTTVRETSIAENATLAQSPPTVTVTFSGPTGLGHVVLSDADGKPVPLDYAPPKAM